MLSFDEGSADQSAIDESTVDENHFKAFERFGVSNEFAMGGANGAIIRFKL